MANIANLSLRNVNEDDVYIDVTQADSYESSIANTYQEIIVNLGQISSQFKKLITSNDTSGDIKTSLTNLNNRITKCTQGIQSSKDVLKKNLSATIIEYAKDIKALEQEMEAGENDLNSSINSVD